MLGAVVFVLFSFARAKRNSFVEMFLFASLRVKHNVGVGATVGR